MNSVPPEIQALLNDVRVTLVCSDPVLNKVLLTQLGYKVSTCEFLNIAHNLTHKKLAFAPVIMNEMLTEHLDMKYDEVLLPRKPNRHQEEVLIDLEIIILSLYSFGVEEIYLRSTRASTQISVLADYENWYLVEVGPKSPAHSVVAAVVNSNNVGGCRKLGGYCFTPQSKA